MHSHLYVASVQTFASSVAALALTYSKQGNDYQVPNGRDNECISYSEQVAAVVVRATLRGEGMA